MRITAIKAQVKRAGRFSIFVDDEYAVSLSDSALLLSKIAPGQEISAEQLDSLKKLSSDDKIYNAVLNYLAIRPRSTWEITTYLDRKGSPALLTEEILNKLSILGLIDDQDFARRWITNRNLLKPTSRYKLTQELRAKRVPDAAIDEELEAAEISDLETLRNLVASKRSKYQDNLKLMQYLSGLGFHYEDIKTVVQMESED